MLPHAKWFTNMGVAESFPKLGAPEELVVPARAGAEQGWRLACWEKGRLKRRRKPPDSATLFPETCVVV